MSQTISLVSLFVFALLFWRALWPAFLFARNRRQWREARGRWLRVSGEFPEVGLTLGRVQFTHFGSPAPKGQTIWHETYRVELDAPYVVKPVSLPFLRAQLALPAVQTDVTDPEFHALIHWFARRHLEVRMADGVATVCGDDTAGPSEAQATMERLELLARRAEELARTATAAKPRDS